MGLVNAKIGGQIDLIGSKVKGKLNMDGMEVENLLMRSGAEFGEVFLTVAKVGGVMDISDSKLKSLDMKGTQIKEEFRLGSEKLSPAKWEDGSKLILRNTEVGVLQDTPRA